MKRRFRTPYGRFAVVRAALLVFLLTAIVVVGVAFMLDRNAQHSNSQQSAAELASGSRVAASVFATLRANLRAHAGNLASSLPLQRAVVTSNRSELRRLAHASNARIVVRGKPFGSLPSAPRVTATATIGDGRRVLARVEIAVKLDDQLLALLGQATPLPRYAGLILVRSDRVVAGGPVGSYAVVRNARLALRSTQFMAQSSPLEIAGTNVVAVEPLTAIAARELPFRRRVLLTAFVTLALAAAFAVRLARPVARVLAELARLTHQAQTDGLTGLANRRTLDDRLAEELDRAERLGGNVSLVLADVDNFKQINDTYGHQTGDAVLEAVARTLRETVRELDLPARYGGEEFALLLPGTRLAGARVIAERVRRALADIAVTDPDGDPVSVTASFGAAAFPTYNSMQALVGAADEALYEAKLGGKNRVATATAKRKAKAEATSTRKLGEAPAESLS